MAMSIFQTHLIGNNTVNIHDQFFLHQLDALVPTDKAFLITDEHLYENYADVIKNFKTIILPSGESHKTQSTVDTAIRQLLDMGADKDTCIVGLGGGVITDMAGYVASIYKRGVRLVLIPTSVLCMVDACLGGKNGVNAGDFKNMVGTIYQPDMILYDYQLLSTLSKEEWVSGFAEIIKHASIADLNLFEWLEQHSLDDFQTHSHWLRELIQRNVRIKLEIVKKDEKEKNDRKLLNFGHTLGHAIEKKYQMPHGHAISLGMVFAAHVSGHFGHMNADEIIRLRHLLQAYHLPVQHDWSVEELMPMILQDKKKEGKFLQYVLLNGLGNAFTKAVDLVSFEALLKDYST